MLVKNCHPFEPSLLMGFVFWQMKKQRIPPLLVISFKLFGSLGKSDDNRW